MGFWRSSSSSRLVHCRFILPLVEQYLKKKVWATIRKSAPPSNAPSIPALARTRKTSSNSLSISGTSARTCAVAGLRCAKRPSEHWNRIIAGGKPHRRGGT